MNRADPNLIEFMGFMVNRCDPAKGESYATAKKLGQELLNNVVGQLPLYKDGEHASAFPEVCIKPHVY
jgi:fatty acid synthase subunit alpha, fungi type